MNQVDDISRQQRDRRLREAYRRGASVSDIIRAEVDPCDESPIDMMMAFMSAFGVGLADVSCIDGWWPPDGDAEVTDDNLNLFVSDAIEERRADWEAEDR